MRLEVDPTQATGYRLVSDRDPVEATPAPFSLAAPAQAGLPKVGEIRGYVDDRGQAVVQVFGGAAWHDLEAPSDSSTGDGGSGFTFTQDAVPTTTKVGDTWFQSSTGLSFVWFDSRWVQFAPGGGGSSTGGGAPAPAPVVTASAWLTTSLDMPAQSPKLSVAPVMLQGHSTTDPTTVDYDVATGKFTFLKAGLYHVMGRAKVLASSDTFTLGANGYEVAFDLRKTANNTSIQAQDTMRIRDEAPPFVIEQLLQCQAVVRFTAGENLYAKIVHGFPQWAGEPANAHGTGKTQLRIAFNPLGGHATAIDIVRLGD